MRGERGGHAESAWTAAGEDGDGRVALHGATGRADLLHAYAAGGELGLAAMARCLGVEEREQAPLPAVTAPSPSEPSRQDAEPSAEPFAPIPFWRLEEIEHLEPEPPPPPLLAVPAIGPDGLGRWPGEPPPTPPIVPQARLWPAIRGRLASTIPSREVDFEALAALWSRGRLAERIPFRPLAAWASRITVLTDRSARLIPFWDDQDRLLRQLRRRLGRGAVHELRFLEGYEQPWRDGRRRYRQPPAQPEVPVLALGDLGFLAGSGEREMWRSIGRHQRRIGARCTALAPCPSGRWQRPVARLWDALEWERPRRAPGAGRPCDETELAERAERLLALLAFATRIEPGLLRTVRRLLPASAADAATEADVWSHPEVLAGFAPAAALSSAARQRLQERFAREPEAVKRGVVTALRAWRAGLPQEIWLDEVLGLHAAADLPAGALHPSEIDAAREMWQRMAETVDAGSGTSPRVVLAVRRFVRRALGGRQPDAVWDDPALRPALWRAWTAAWQGEGDPPLPAAVGLEMLGGGESAPRRWRVHQVGATLHFAPAGRALGVGSPLVELTSANGQVGLRGPTERFAQRHLLEAGAAVPLPSASSLVLRTDRNVATLRSAVRPQWASAMGRDRFGLWASFTIEGEEHRMRWIPPGRFLMGSPENEPGRWGDEGPRHLETAADGYWLAETPCTQALWRAVMGENPSRFQSPDRPVEQVSWEDCRRFLAALNQRIEGLDARLPSEVEWEYACRAGTETATYAGAMEIRGQRDAPVLDAIAWYGGNSGEGFELEGGHDSSDWPEKQYPHTRAGTRPVAQKGPNPWGLYDMLGNVNEWCEDLWCPSYEAPREGTYRVIRGGSWGTIARLATEAEWEYACRAGTETATYAGDLQILGLNHAPLLDRIAWYGGNSGVGYDLDEWEDSSGWSEKQHSHQRAGTRIVALKEPNPWGLYDMLGNVWEWCGDWYGHYAHGGATDPRGPAKGPLRVIRGGSWSSFARSVRAADRDHRDPSYRWSNLGFRLARGQE